MKVWPRKPNPAAAARIASHGVRLIRDTEAAAAEAAKTADTWAEGMSPAEYLEALVDRAQARTKETPDE